MTKRKSWNDLVFLAFRYGHCIEGAVYITCEPTSLNTIGTDFDVVSVLFPLWNYSDAWVRYRKESLYLSYISGSNNSLKRLTEAAFKFSRFCRCQRTGEALMAFAVIFQLWGNCRLAPTFE